MDVVIVILCHFAKLTNAAIEPRLGANAAKRVEFGANVERGQRSYWRRRRALIASMVGDAAITVMSCARLRGVPRELSNFTNFF